MVEFVFSSDSPKHRKILDTFMVTLDSSWFPSVPPIAENRIFTVSTEKWPTVVQLNHERRKGQDRVQLKKSSWRNSHKYYQDLQRLGRV